MKLLAPTDAEVNAVAMAIIEQQFPGAIAIEHVTLRAARVLARHVMWKIGSMQLDERKEPLPHG